MFGIIEDGTYRVERIGFSTPTLTTGYVVGVRSITREADIPAEGTLFGRWTTADGTVYWDAVEIIEDLHTALQTAAQRGELAIWDVVGQCEQYTGASSATPEPIAFVDYENTNDVLMSDGSTRDYFADDDPFAYSVRVMTVDGIEEETTNHTNQTDAWNAFDEAASWGMGWYRTLSDAQGTVIAEGVTA